MARRQGASDEVAYRHAASLIRGNPRRYDPSRVTRGESGG
jgi:hypothetical protein